jgi:hypothetical protein
MLEIAKMLDVTISQYVRPDTFPVVVKFLRKGEEVPACTKISINDFGYPSAKA